MSRHFNVVCDVGFNPLEFGLVGRYGKVHESPASMPLFDFQWSLTLAKLHEAWIGGGGHLAVRVLAPPSMCYEIGRASCRERVF